MVLSTARPPVRVLLVDHAAGLAGAEIAMARLLSVIDRERFEPSVLLLADGPLVDRLRGLDISTRVLSAPAGLVGVGRERAASARGFLGGALRTAGLLPRLVAAIRASGARLVVANSLKAAVLTAVAAPLAGRPWVWHLHDRVAPDYLPAAAVRLLRTLAARAPRLVVANSRATLATLPGLRAARSVVAYPGVEIGPPPPPRTPSRHPSFALVGRIAPTKGQREFLHAAALLAHDEPDAAFAVVGDAMFNDAEFAGELRTLPAALGLGDRVAFTGWVDDPMGTLQAVTAAVHASPVPEPFGQVVVEAMMAGVPVIATRAGGVPEIIDPDSSGIALAPGVTRTPLGLLVEPGDAGALARAMAWVARNPDSAEGMAAAARRSAVERFDIRSTARIVETAWLSALRPRAVSAPLPDGRPAAPAAVPTR